MSRISPDEIAFVSRCWNLGLSVRQLSMVLGISLGQAEYRYKHRYRSHVRPAYDRPPPPADEELHGLLKK